MNEIQIPQEISFGEGEIPVWSGKRSWASTWFLLLLGILTIWFFLIGLIFFLIAALEVYASEYFVSNKRVFIKYGIISRRIFDIKVEWVTNFVISQSIVGRILNYGHLVVSTPGEFGGASVMRGVTDPFYVKTIIEKSIKGAKGPLT